MAHLRGLEDGQSISEEIHQSEVQAQTDYIWHVLQDREQGRQQETLKQEIEEVISIAGRLKDFRNSWESITNDASFLQCNEGYEISFVSQTMEVRAPTEPSWLLREREIMNVKIIKLENRCDRGVP